MKKLKQLYRILATAVLIAVVANVLLPTSAAAARYICNIEYMQPIRTTRGDALDGHCSQPGSMTTDHTQAPCSFEQICSFAPQREIAPLILPSTPYAWVAIIPLTGLETPPPQDHGAQLLTETIYPFTSPPIFLLNSTFLN